MEKDKIRSSIESEIAAHALDAVERLMDLATGVRVLSLDGSVSRKAPDFASIKYLLDRRLGPPVPHKEPHDAGTDTIIIDVDPY